MPKSKTLKRECQICGRFLKASKGLIAHHGFKRPGYGWQTASCFGARHLPYDESCDAILPAIESVKEFISRTETCLADFVANPPATLAYVTGTWTKTTTNVERPEDFKVDGVRYSYSSRSYEYVFDDTRDELKKSIKEAKATQTYLEKRLADWKPVVQAIAEEA